MLIALYTLDNSLAQGWRAEIQTRKIDEVHVIQGDILDGHASAKARRKAVNAAPSLGLE